MKRTSQRGLSAQQTGCAAPALAMIGFGEVGEFEINRKGFGDAVGVVDG